MHMEARSRAEAKYKAVAHGVHDVAKESTFQITHGVSFNEAPS